MNKIEYAIYCRKSTDESSGQQTQSIPDQIMKCVEYAENNELTIMEKPANFLDFETVHDIVKEDNDKDRDNREIFQTTRNLFIVKEQQSGKIPGKRPKWRKLIEMVEKGEIKWLLSYAPDRQARNMVEGGELINLVDNELLDLKYTNFHFENNASGKMMLGIWFVFSKQYSDKLSEDINRGNKTTVKRGKSLWEYKAGYIRDHITGYYKVDKHNFDLMREAFELKIYAKATDVYISERLNDNDFHRVQKSGKRIYMNINTLRRIWKDPFYYGIYEVGGKRSDQRVDNPQYKPLITEAEYELLKEEYTKRKKRQRKKVTVPNKYHSIIPLPPGMLIDSEGYSLVRYVAKMKEFNQKLEELRETNPHADYDNVVSSRHIRYRVSNKESKSYKLELTFDKIEEAIIKKLDQINIDEKELKKYIAYKEQEFIMENKAAREQRIKITEKINQLAEQKEQYAREHIHFRRSMQHKDEYQQQLKSFNKQINKLEKEFKKIKFDERNILREFEVFVSILQNIGEYYRNASFVQRKNLSEILRSNILVDREKGLTVQANPSIESLFSNEFSVSGGAENRTPV